MLCPNDNKFIKNNPDAGYKSNATEEVSKQQNQWSFKTRAFRKRSFFLGDFPELRD